MSKAKQLRLNLPPSKLTKSKPSRLAGVQKGKPDTCPPGLAMGASGWPVYSLVMADPPPEAGEKIAAVMLRQEVLERAIEQTRRRQDEQVEQELQALASRPESRGWELPPDVARFVEDETHWLQEQARYCRTDEERRDLLTNAVANGFLFAIERYFEALRNVPELKQLKAAEQARKATAITGKRDAMLARAREAGAMVDRGDSIADVAAHFEVDKSRVYAWLRELQKQRV